MATNLDQNLRTTFTLGNVVSSTPILSRAWQIDAVPVQNNTTETLIIPIGTLTGFHTISCTLENDCGSATNSLDVNYTNGLLPVITNSTFDTEISPWILDMMGGVGNASVINGEAGLNITTIGTDVLKNRFYQSGFTLKPNTPYYLFVDVKSNNNAGIEVYLNDTTNYNTHIIPGGSPDPRDIPTTNSMMTTRISFTTPANVPGDMTLRFKFPTPGIYTLDNISIIEVSAPPVLDSIELTGCTASVQVGGICDLVAVCRDQYGSVLTCGTLSWMSTDTAIATVSQAGRVTGIAQGSCEIRASSGLIIGTKTVTISQVPCISTTWTCEVPASGYEVDNCGNRRANSRCNPCVPVWACRQPLDGYEINSCDGSTRLNPLCNPVPTVCTWLNSNGGIHPLPVYNISRLVRAYLGYENLGFVVMASHISGAVSYYLGYTSSGNTLTGCNMT